jgi:hypothetical protein
MSPPDSSNSDAPGRTVARNSTVDAVVAACLVVIGLVEVIEARRLGAGWTTDGPGAGYFPFYVGLILLISGAAILVQSLRARKATTAPSLTACNCGACCRCSCPR